MTDELPEDERTRLIAKLSLGRTVKRWLEMRDLLDDESEGVFLKLERVDSKLLRDCERALGKGARGTHLGYPDHGARD